MINIDLNADMGEGIGNDTQLLDIVSSANIACGGHAGDDNTMRETIRAAKIRNIRIGAHPGFMDKENFGRVRLDLTAIETSKQVIEQISNFIDIASQEDAKVSYVKLHGALANMAAEEYDLAFSIFSEIKARYPTLAILALENSAQQTAAENLNMSVIREAYADRAYLENGLLTPRSMDGSVLHDTSAIISQCLNIALNKSITTIDNKTLKTKATSICIHGDTEGAVNIAYAIKDAFAKNKILIAL